MIGIAGRARLQRFPLQLTPVAVLVMAVQALMIHVLWGRALRASPETPHPGHGHECAGDDQRLGAAAPLAFVIGAVLVAFVLARPLHLQPATIALAGAAVLMLLDNW